MYGELVYRLSKRYGRERRESGEEYPYFKGAIADLIPAPNQTLLDLQGEHVIWYRADGVYHCIHVYFEAGSFEAEGM